MKLNNFSLFLLRLAISYIWLRAGLSKLLDEQFISTFPQTLTKFAEGTTYDFYSIFIHNCILPHSLIFAQLTVWGEILTGIAFLLGFPMTLAVSAGIFMNINYFFVATTIPSQFLNILMIVSEFTAYTNNAGSIWGLEKKR